MYVAALATALPERAWSQKECWGAVLESRYVKTLKRRSLDILERVMLGESGIEQRHFCLDGLTDVFDRSAEQLNRTFEREAPRLGAQALRGALEKAGVGEVQALFVCTCTGYLCPGLSSHIAEMLNLPPDVYLVDMTGAGCGAAIPAIRSACNYLAVNPDHRAAVVAVEICSAAFYIDNDPGVLISLCLFGDGAAAMVLDGRGSGWRLSDFRSLHLPAEREKIRFINREGKLVNQLHRAVPEVAASAVEQLYPASNGNSPRMISHAGGRDVLTAIRARLPEQSLSEAAEVLRRCGNMSSPSVLFALDAALQENGSTPDRLWLVSFGAGFACHGCSLTR